MSHPGFNSPLIADAERALSEVVLSDTDRDRATAALDQLREPWAERHRAAYEAGVSTRDTQYARIDKATELLSDRIDQERDDLKAGRITAAEARAWLRDALNAHRKLAEESAALSTSDERLTEFEAMEPADYQAEQLRTFPTLANGAPTLISVINGGMQ